MLGPRGALRQLLGENGRHASCEYAPGQNARSASVSASSHASSSAAVIVGTPSTMRRRSARVSARGEAWSAPAASQTAGHRAHTSSTAWRQTCAAMWATVHAGSTGGSSCLLPT